MWWSNSDVAGRGVGVEQAALAAGGHRHADAVGDALAERAGGHLDAEGVAVLGVARGERAPGAQRLEVGELEAVAGQEQLAVLGQRGVPVGQDEPVAADPVRVGRVVAHHPLVEQVGQRRQAIAVPGWPLPAFCTASAASSRAVLTALVSRSVHQRGWVLITSGSCGGCACRPLGNRSLRSALRCSTGRTTPGRARV